MALPISSNTAIATKKTIKEPNLVLTIEGYNKSFGSGVIKEIIKIADPGLYIDGSWLIGGQRIRANQGTNLALDGSSSSIQQQLDAEKARGSSIQSMQIELVDLNKEITKLISPGVVLDDLLGKKAAVYLAVDNSSAKWPDDYEILFRGNIDDIGTLPASILLNIAHPDQKKKQSIWPKAETDLTFSITNTDTTIDLNSVAGFLKKVIGPSGSVDSDFKTYVVIENEVIEYQDIIGNQLISCTRGQLGTQALSHLAGAHVTSLLRLTGDAMTIALKLMMSREDYYLTGKTISNFNVLHAPDNVPNAIYFEGFDASVDYGYTVGDFITTTGASNGANNVTLKEITGVFRTDFGSYITVDGVTFVDEVASAALISFRSKYDVWPLAAGMGGDEIDVDQHEQIRLTNLSGFLYDFYIKDTVDDAKEFIEQEIYKPAAAYSVPRKAKASVVLMQPPLPNVNTKLLNESNIINPSKIKMRRTINKQFANTIVYKFDESPIEDKFLSGDVQISATSLNQIKVGYKALPIVSKGLRTSSNGVAQAQQAAQRKLNRFQFGAEYFEGVQVTFGVGFSIEVGDVVILDGSKLSLADTTTGLRNRPAQLVEVQNKVLNYRTGEVKLDLVSTGYNGAGKYALIGPASRIKAGIDDKTFVIEKAYTSIYGVAEYQKWIRYTNVAVKIRSPDGVTRYAQTTIKSALSNTIIVNDSLGFTPQAGDLIELAQHDFVDTSGEIKLLYGFMSPLNGGSVPPYQFV